MHIYLCIIAVICINSYTFCTKNILLYDFQKEGENQVKMAIQESLTFMASSLSKAKQDVKDFLEKLLAQQIESVSVLVQSRVCFFLSKPNVLFCTL